jgi:hypothetical protein
MLCTPETLTHSAQLNIILEPARGTTRSINMTGPFHKSLNAPAFSIFFIQNKGGKKRKRVSLEDVGRGGTSISASATSSEGIGGRTDVWERLHRSHER